MATTDTDVMHREADAIRLLVCTTCRSPGDASAELRPGDQLTMALEHALSGAPLPWLTVEPVACLSVCKRPCTVALTGARRWTYVYGDLDSETAAATLIAFAKQYRASVDGIVPWRERADAIRKGVVARVPPLPAPTRMTE